MVFLYIMADKTTPMDGIQENDELVLEDNQLVCVLTNKVVKATDKELTLQSMIDMMAEEYGFAPEDMERDFRVTYQEPDSEKSRAQSVDLAIFNEGKAHEVENLIRFVVVAKDAKVKPTDAKKGAEAMLDNILTFTDCEFGCWTNGEDLLYRYYTEDDFGQADVQDISDFPANGQTLADLEAQGDRAMPRKPANESLIKTFKRCHDYIYGNEGMKKTAFWELLNLIFCKLYDEKRRNADAKEGISYRRRFWVGVTEQFTEEGRKAVATRIRGLFEELKDSQMFRDVFDGSEQIMLSDRGLAFVAAELAKYSFLDATVDVKGTAYETIVSNTLKQEAGQFFTPRNIIKCMVETARFFMSFTQNESCGKCVPCREGTKRMLEILDRIVSNEGTMEDLELLENLSNTITETALCGLGQSACKPVQSTLRYFRDEYLAHVVDHHCPICNGRKRHLEIIPELCKGCGKCARNCPMDAISGQIRMPHVIDTTKCIHCGACWGACPFGAIDAIEEEV